MNLKERADARLEAALATAGLEDSRPVLRARLRRLKGEDQVAFAQAVKSYEEEVVPALADGPAPLDAWLGFARTLGERTGAGRLVAIDATGRAAPYADPYRPGDLVVHLPDDPAAPALAAALPAAASDQQRAAYDLLILGQLGS